MSTPSFAAKHPYEWMSGPSLRELYDRLTAAGPDIARLERRVHSDNTIWYRVVTAEGGVVQEGGQAIVSVDGCEDVDNVHVCPIDCG